MSQVFQSLRGAPGTRPRWCLVVGSLLLSCLHPPVSPAAEPQGSPPQKSRLILVSQGPDGHPATTHEYDAGAKLLAAMLSRIPELQVEVWRADGSWDEGPAKLREAHGAVLFLSQGAKWIHEEPRRLEAFAQLAARGGGLSALHWAMGTREPQFIEGFVKLFGGCHGGPDRKYQVVETTVRPADNAHEITRGINPFRVREEFYYRLKWVSAGPAWKPLVVADIDGQAETVSWAWDRGDGGRSFGFSGCHFHRNWELLEYRRLVVQGILWTMRVPIPPEGIAVDVSPGLLQLP